MRILILLFLSLSFAACSTQKHEIDNTFKNEQSEKAPGVMNGRYLGDYLKCNDGFKNKNGQCEKLPEVTNGRYVNSHRWLPLHSQATLPPFA